MRVCTFWFEDWIPQRWLCPAECAIRYVQLTCRGATLLVGLDKIDLDVGQPKEVSAEVHVRLQLSGRIKTPCTHVLEKKVNYYAVITMCSKSKSYLNITSR